MCDDYFKILPIWILSFFKHTSRRKNEVPTPFLNMPLDVANLVLKKLELMDLLRVRKVCRSLRTAVDEFGLLFDYINLFLRKDEVEIQLSGGTKIIYTTAANVNTNVNLYEQKKFIYGENIVERATKDFKILSRHARRIIIRNWKDSDIVATFKFLKSEACIPVKEIRLVNVSFDDVLTILPCFDAKVLKNIELVLITSIGRFERITHLEQWKKAENFELSMSEIAGTMIAHFFHFKCFRIQVKDEFPAQIAIQIRDDLLRRSTFQSCEVDFDRSKSNPIEIAKVFQPDYDGDNEFNIKFSNGNDKFDISLKDCPWSFVLNVKRL